MNHVTIFATADHLMPKLAEELQLVIIIKHVARKTDQYSPSIPFYWTSTILSPNRNGKNRQIKKYEHYMQR